MGTGVWSHGGGVAEAPPGGRPRWPYVNFSSGRSTFLACHAAKREVLGGGDMAAGGAAGIEADAGKGPRVRSVGDLALEWCVARARGERRIDDRAYSLRICVRKARGPVKLHREIVNYFSSVRFRTARQPIHWRGSSGKVFPPLTRIVWYGSSAGWAK